MITKLFLEKGKCLRELTKYQESIEDLKIAVEKLGKSSIPKRYQAQAHNELGFSLHENGQFDMVSEYLT